MINISVKKSTRSIDTEDQNLEEPWMIEMLKQFILSTTRVWKCMYDNHVSPIKKTCNIDVSIPSSVNLTRYIDYAKNIRDFKIKLPDWFLLSSGTVVQKIIPCYDNVIDMMPLVLIDLFFPRGKTFIFVHMNNTMMRSGMHVSDIVTRCIFKCFGNPYCLSYIRNYVTSPERCFMIMDHYSAYYEHLKFAILDKNIKRMVLLSSRQVFIMLDIIKDSKYILISDISLIDYERGEECKDILCVNIDDNDQSTNLVFKKLWPDLEIIILLKDGYFNVHTARIKKYFGNVILYSPIYFIPEITFGYNINVLDKPYLGISSLQRANSTHRELLAKPCLGNTYVLDPTKGFFEFIHINNNFKDPNIRTIGIRHLKIGEMYNIVVSTMTMELNRYITGEIIRVIDYYNGSPEIEIICRETDIIYTNNDIITPDKIENILYQKLQIVDYCYRYGDKNQILTKHMIKLYIELEEKDYMYRDPKSQNDYSSSKNSHGFEGEHKNVSAYDVNRNIKELNITAILLNELGIDTEIRIVKPKTFDKLYRSRYTEHIDPAFIQIPKMVTDIIDFDILRDNILYMF
jgi:hypothetical protein